jgi:16S rRNA (guanine(527)-N(7))-methyltransferase RsmG
LSAATVDRLVAYADLLSFWNRRLNLTGFKLDGPSPEAVDRLLIEPLLATRHVPTGDQVLFLCDVGSGGGSPAIPLVLGLGSSPNLTMVEARSRKSTFLREAIRHLQLTGEVVTSRFGDFAASATYRYRYDVVTLRAVRPEGDLWPSTAGVLKPLGRLLWFHNEQQRGPVDESALEFGPPLRLEESLASRLTIATKWPIRV